MMHEVKGNWLDINPKHELYVGLSFAMSFLQTISRNLLPGLSGSGKLFIEFFDKLKLSKVDKNIEFLTAYTMLDSAVRWFVNDCMYSIAGERHGSLYVHKLGSSIDVVYVTMTNVEWTVLARFNPEPPIPPIEVCKYLSAMLETERALQMNKRFYFSPPSFSFQKEQESPCEQ